MRDKGLRNKRARKNKIACGLAPNEPLVASQGAKSRLERAETACVATPLAAVSITRCRRFLLAAAVVLEAAWIVVLIVLAVKH
jgi:hypothetical protein